MGAACLCRSSKSLANDDGVYKHTIPVPSKNGRVPSDSKASTCSPEDVLDDSFKDQIDQAVDESVATIPAAYQFERDRIVNELRQSAPEPYLGLLFSDYPHVNGSSVHAMAHRIVTSHESQQKLIDDVNHRVEPTLTSKTADWNSASKATARLLVITFVEKRVQQAVNAVTF